MDRIRKGQGKIAFRAIWLLITRKCPLECRHCYFCGSPDGESLTPAEVDRILDHLPASVESIGVSGGEPFTERNLLHRTLRRIRERGFAHLTNLDVQTVGYWARGRAQVKRTVAELLKLGANCFLVYGHDSWHWERGLDRKRQELLVEVLESDFGIGPAPKGLEGTALRLQRNHPPIYSFKSTGPILPLGRAEWATGPGERKSPRTEPTCPCRPFLRLDPHGYYYSVNFGGEAHFCLFQTTRPLGNAIKEPIAGMLRRARGDEYFRILSEGTLIDFAQAFCGMPRKEAAAAIAEKGTCVFCHELQTRLLADSPDRPVLHEVIERERHEFGRSRGRPGPSGARGEP